MKIHSLRLRNIRCFEDTGDLLFSPRLNILVGHNNSGKSTILKAIFGLQSHAFDNNDVRPSRFDDKSFVTVVIVESIPTDYLNFPKGAPQPDYRLLSTYRGQPETTFSGDYTL
jgi:energy-coupling factor transporter ATP-binding protein EcfA2